MAGFSLRRRIEALEKKEAQETLGPAFLWCQGQSLDDALARYGLTREGGPYLAIRLEGVRPGEKEPRLDHLFEKDRQFVQ